MNIFELAKWFKVKEPSLSDKKLQKLCWYAYSWYLTLNFNPEKPGEFNKLIEDRAQAWVHGPVFSNLYADGKYEDYTKVNDSPEIKNKEIISFLEEVYDIYGKYSGDDLESITHQESPWKNARIGYTSLQSCRKLIEDKDILDEYLPRLIKN